MGVIVRYTCKHCGFVADDVLIGQGFVSYREAVVCQDCGCVFSAATDWQGGTAQDNHPHCNGCGGSNIVVWDHRCPKCGSTSVDEEAVGMWD